MSRYVSLFFLALVWGTSVPTDFVLAAPSFHADRNYPDLGLRIRVLGKSEPEPLPPCKTYTYTFTRGEEHFTRDLCDPRELWYATQHAGQWRDEAGNRLILGRATRLLPSFHGELKHVPREAFDQALADGACAFDPASASSLREWVQAFSACTPKDAEPLRTTSFNLLTALFFPVEEPATLVYAFRVKVRALNGTSAPSDWYCAVIGIADGTQKAKVRKDFETQFLANVAALAPSGTASSPALQPKNLTGALPSAAIPDSPSRTAARKSVANMRDWWYAETPDYIFLSNIRSAAGKSLIKELQQTLPVLRGAFAKLIPPLETAVDVSVVRICETEETYKAYVGRNMEWSSGVWNPMRRELVILSQGKDKDRTLEIIRHEGFHQYLFYATRGLEHAVWFNEGHACFFESAVVDSKGRVDLPEDKRCDHLLRNLDLAADQIPRLIHLSYEAFYSGSEEQRSLNYTTAWALVYFLRKGAPAEKRTAYASILDTYMKTLAETKDADKAVTAAFANVSMPRFQADFVTFWKTRRGMARRFDPLN